MRHPRAILLAALLAAPLAGRAEEPQKVTFDLGGWLVMHGFRDGGEFDTRELPRYVLNQTVADQFSSGWAVRQSRVRAGLTMPTDNFLEGSSVKGLVEVDFMGGAPNGAAASTVDPAIIRLRHVYLAANWKQTANLTLIVGQTWGVAQGLNFAESLAHLAVPRFGGAGFLYRRAPQARLQADFPTGPLTLKVAGAVLTPGDFGSQTSSSAGNVSGIPNFEGKIGAAVKNQGLLKSLDLNFLTHYGQERYLFANNTLDATVASQLFELEGKIDFGYAWLLGGAWQGQNLDVYNSIGGFYTTATAPNPDTRNGVVLDTTNPADPKARAIESQGAYAQVGIPWHSVLLVGGLGFENPKDSTLVVPGAALPNSVILRNTQYSGALIWNVSSRWRVSAEYTRFITFARAASGPGNDTLTGNSFQLGSLFAL